MRSKGALNLKINKSEYHKNRERKKKEKKKKRKREKEERKKKKEEKKRKKGCQQHPVFPGGHPSKY